MATKVEQRLTDGVDTIDFIRSVEYAEPDDFDHIIHKTKSGDTVIYVRSSQKEFDVDIICTKTQADTTIRSWITDRDQLTFTPDLTGAPATTHTVRILNKIFSMVPWSMTQWRGTLRLRKE